MMRPLVYTLIFLFAMSFTSCAKRVVVRQPVGVTVVQKLPRQHNIVRVNGTRYYVFNGRHHRKTRQGYVVVNL